MEKYIFFWQTYRALSIVISYGTQSTSYHLLITVRTNVRRRVKLPNTQYKHNLLLFPSFFLQRLRLCVYVCRHTIHRHSPTVQAVSKPLLLLCVCICEFEITQRKNTLLLLLAHWSMAMSHSLIYNLSQCIARCVRVRSWVHDSCNTSARSAVACVSRLTQHRIRVDNKTLFERDATIVDRYGGSPFHSNEMRTHS